MIPDWESWSRERKREFLPRMAARMRQIARQRGLRGVPSDREAREERELEEK